MFLTEKYKDFLFWDVRRLTEKKLREYAEKIEESNGVDMICGFIDGTTIEIVRLYARTADQNLYYSGYKRIHVIKFQGLITPDDLILSVFGPFYNKFGDWKLFRENKLEMIFLGLFGYRLARERLYVYGDPAYTGSGGAMGVY